MCILHRRNWQPPASAAGHQPSRTPASGGTAKAAAHPHNGQVYPALDAKGRPIVLMRPRCENTKTYDRQIKFLVYILEQASRIADQQGEAAIPAAG